MAFEITWEAANIYHRADDMVRLLLQFRILDEEDIDNIYIMDEFAVKHKVVVLEWYNVSEAAFNILKAANMVVFRVNELCFWGKTFDVNFNDLLLNRFVK